MVDAAPFTPPAEFDDYLLGRRLGAGRAGQVWAAEDTVLARPVAIKFLAGVPDPATRRQFLLEARATARVHHPNVVGVYRVGEVDNHPYLVSELIRGRALDELPRPRPWTEVLTLAVDLARGLAAAHRSGVVHCDVKPANVMVADDGAAKLVDFGLARMTQDRDAGRAGLVGTPDYMAPEVWRGEAPTRRSDVYSLGALLFELCAGRPPFADTPPAALAEAVTGGAAPAVRDRAPDVDPRLAAIIDRCLERDPERRYPSGDELRDALEQLARRRDAVGAPSGNPYRGLRPFEASHRAMFFGRDLEIGQLVERLRTEPIVIVAGDSGVGKSSLCRAGVVPALVDGELGQPYTALTMVPGTRPLTTLAALLDDPALVDELPGEPTRLAVALRRRAGTGGLVLFIDQLEELVTLGDPAQVAAVTAGLARLAGGVAGVRVLATARADFLSRLAALPGLASELARLLCFVAPLPRERLREVIVGPAQAAGARFASDAMVAELVDATAAAGSGGLPLLSFALAALWEERDVVAGEIGAAALAAVGGVDGALARHGDAVLAGLPPTGRAVARRVLTRLVTTAGTRARRAAEALVTDATGRTVLEALVRGRLLVIHDAGDGPPLYELAHEVLVTGWATLREWLELDAEARALRERLTAAAAEWHRRGSRADATWRGLALAEAAALPAGELTALERDFVRASVGAARRRRWALRGAALAVVSLAVGGYVGLRWQARRRIERAVAREVHAADAARAAATASGRDLSTLRAEAFATFDRGDDAAGEAAWSRAQAARQRVETNLRDAARHLEVALVQDPARRDVRDQLGDVLFERAALADATHDHALRDELLARLPASDRDGHRRAQWQRPGRLTVTTPPGSTVTIEPGAAAVAAGTTTVALPAGTYLVHVTGPSGVAIQAPVAVQRDADVALTLTPPPRPPPAGLVYVPPGDVGYGAAVDDDVRQIFLYAAPLHDRHVDAFLIGRDEVTVGEWLRFVDAQPPARQEALLPHLDAKLGTSGALELTRGPTGWQYALQPVDQPYRAGWGEPVVYPGRTEHARQDWRRFPITGVTATMAEAYAAWLDATGAVPGARLCTEVEWERAARGVDGRPYPGGATVAITDANLDATHGRDNLGPDEVGSHPASTSVFGIHDVVGNAYEWTRAVSGGDYAVRGGSYFHDRLTAHLANRQVTTGGLRDATVGFRVCATPQPK